MKHGFKSLLLIILCATALSTTAADGPNIVFRQTGVKSFALYMTADSDQAIKVKLMDAVGVVLHNAVIKNTTEISQIYNLSNLPSGAYTLVIDEKFKTYIQPIIIIGNEVDVDVELLTTVYAPAIRRNGQYLDFDLYCDEMTEIKYSFLSNGEIILENDFSEKGAVQRRFNLDQLKTGSYDFKLTLELEGVQRTFNKTIKI